MLILEKMPALDQMPTYEETRVSEEKEKLAHSSNSRIHISEKIPIFPISPILEIQSSETIRISEGVQK